MEYIIMSLEEAKKIAKKDAIVLIAKQDLEKSNCNIGFERKKFGDCHNILEQAETIAKICDDFAAQLRVFSEKQENALNYRSLGSMTTMLFSKF